MCSSLDHKQEATNNFRSESSQGDHWHKGHKFPLHRNQSKSCGFRKQEESQHKIWTNVNFGGMDRNGFRTVRKHGQLGISQWLLKKHWRRLKVKQRARKPSMKRPTWLEKTSMKGRLKAKISQHPLSPPSEWMKRNILPFFGFFELQRGY